MWDLSQASLRGKLAALELALKGKEAELERLMQMLRQKDRTIQELKRLKGEGAAVKKRAKKAEEAKAWLEKELSDLQSQTRIHHLSITKLQDRLARAYAAQEEMARKLKLAEEALRDKVYKWS